MIQRWTHPQIVNRCHVAVALVITTTLVGCGVRDMSESPPSVSTPAPMLAAPADVRQAGIDVKDNKSPVSSPMQVSRPSQAGISPTRQMSSGIHEEFFEDKATAPATTPTVSDASRNTPSPGMLRNGARVTEEFFSSGATPNR